MEVLRRFGLCTLFEVGGVKIVGGVKMKHPYNLVGLKCDQEEQKN